MVCATLRRVEGGIAELAVKQGRSSGLVVTRRAVAGLAVAMWAESPRQGQGMRLDTVACMSQSSHKHRLLCLHEGALCRYGAIRREAGVKGRPVDINTKGITPTPTHLSRS